MTERFPDSNEKDNDKDDERSETPKERYTWRPPESTPPPAWQPERPQPQVPEPEELRRYAAERQAQLLTEWSLDEKEDKENHEAEKEERPERPSPESNVPAAPETPSAEAPIETQPENAEASPEEIEAAKDVAREQLQDHEATPDDPTTDYLEKVVETGKPAEAEQQTIQEHGLDEVQAEAELLVQDLEELLEKTAAKVGDRELSDQEMLDLAREMAPEAEAKLSEEKAFAPEPARPPDLSTLPTGDILSTPNVRHHFRKAPPIPNTGSGSPPPPPVPPRGGGGGGGGSGGGLNGFSSFGNAMNPNIHMRAAWEGLSRAERLRLRRKNLSHVLLAGLLGYYIGRHFGRKKGNREATAALRPELERQAKINKRQDAEILAGQKRIESLKRMKDAQDREAARPQNRERLTVPRAVPQTPEVLLPPSQSPMERTHRPEQPARSPERLTAPPLPTTPEFIAVPGSPPATLESRPSLQPEQSIRTPEVVAAGLPAAEHVSDRPAENQPAQTTPESPQTSPETPYVNVAPEWGAIPEGRPAEAAGLEPEELQRPFTPVESFASTRPWQAEMASTRPGLEVPLPTGAPESTEPPFTAETVSSMNMPELLTVAKEITVGGQDLGEIFQQNKIDAEGLKRVIAEYARGGNAELALAEERRTMETRRQSPEFLRGQAADAASGAGTQGGGGAGGLSVPLVPPNTEHLLPAYEHEQYPSDMPQHLLAAYDQATTARRHRSHQYIMVIGGLLIGLGLGMLIILLLR